MPIELTLEGGLTIAEASEAIRLVLPDASKNTENAPRGGLTMTAPFLWISMGPTSNPRRTPDATVEPTCFVNFRLDKFALGESEARAIRCINAILQNTKGDCVLVQNFGIPILARIRGEVRLYQYGKEPSFWDRDEPRALLEMPARSVQAEHRWEDEVVPPDTDMILEGLFPSRAKVRETIRSVLTSAEEETGDPLSFDFRLTTPLVEATVGPGDLPVETPDGTVGSSCSVMFALDQEALMDAEVLALRCVNAILEATHEDCGLLLIEKPILARITGEVRLYLYGMENELWDVSSMRELITVPARTVHAKHRPWETQ